MKRYWLVVVLLLSFGINIGLLLGRLAPSGIRPSEERPLRIEGEGLPQQIRRRVDTIADELGLSGERRQDFLDIQRQFFLETRRARQQVQRVQQELRREVFSRHPNETRIEALLERLGRAYVHQERAFATNLVASRKLLTPAQERRFLRFLQQLRQSGYKQRPGGRSRQRQKSVPRSDPRPDQLTPEDS